MNMRQQAQIEIQKSEFKHKKPFSVVGVAGHWHRMPSEALKSPSLETSRCNCAQSSTACSSSPCFDQRVALDNLQRHLPTSAFPSFCDTSIYLFPRFYPIILILFIALGKKWTEQALWKMSVALSNYLERIWESIFQVISILELWQSLINLAVFSSPCACWRFSTPYMDV